MGEPVLSIQNLSAWYGREKTVLCDFSFQLYDHEAAKQARTTKKA